MDPPVALPHQRAALQTGAPVGRRPASPALPARVATPQSLHHDALLDAVHLRAYPEFVRALAESVTNALTISTVFTFLVGCHYSTLRDSYDEQRHRFSIHNWNQDWVF